MGAKIGDLIKFYRKQAGFSQENLGKGICSAKYIGQIERGENIPTLDIVDQISDKLKVNIYYAYSYAHKFPNIEAYKVALDINKALTVNDDDRLEELYKKYSGTKDFQKGEAFLLMTYIESLFLADSKEYLKASKVIENKFPEYKDLCLEEEKRISGVEQALVLSYAIDMRNIGKKRESAGNIKSADKKNHKSFNQ